MISQFIILGVTLAAVAQADDSPPPGYGPATEAQRQLIGQTVEFAVPKGLSTPESLRFDKPFQQGPHCGPNGLYSMLRLCGIQVTYDDVSRRIPLDAKGTDLETLRRVAAEFGLETEVRKLTPEELSQARKPMLVHLNTPAAGPGHTPGAEGHFTVVTRIDPMGMIEGIDTSNALYTTWDVQRFARGASGYCLIPIESSREWLVGSRGLFLTSVFAQLIVIDLVLLFYLQRSEAHASA
jgi:ABC-type bacteriocin/lantibiotic exporter with double-glycine peptidase domain